MIVEADFKDKRGTSTPLSYAVQYGREETVKLFLGRDDVEADSKDDKGWTPLSFAAWHGQDGD
ncbi:hypothetical protein SERLA73DRAFT_81789, partial [Serpula lacrymans var. lacrymans S7.3]